MLFGALWGSQSHDPGFMKYADKLQKATNGCEVCQNLVEGLLVVSYKTGLDKIDDAFCKKVGLAMGAGCTKLAVVNPAVAAACGGVAAAFQTKCPKSVKRLKSFLKTDLKKEKLPQAAKDATPLLLDSKAFKSFMRFEI